MAYESDSSLKLYLREISKTPLLTAEEEVSLAARIKNGDAEARSHMIRANLRLVVKIAQDYSNYGMPVTDLISEGNIGLMKAVERFDPEKGGKLSTYAAWWIKQSIKRALANQSKTIRLPVHMVDKIAKMRRIAAILTEALGRAFRKEAKAVRALAKKPPAESAPEMDRFYSDHYRYLLEVLTPVATAARALGLESVHAEAIAALAISESRDALAASAGANQESTFIAWETARASETSQRIISA